MDAAGEAHRPAGGDHRLRRDAVPQVGGAADDVAFDHRDLRAEAGGVGRGGVAGRPAADDHESSCHRGRKASGAQSAASAQPSSANIEPRLSVPATEGFDRTIRDVGAVPRRILVVVARFTDPFEVHAVGVHEVAAPREVVGPEDPHHAAIHLRHAALAVRAVLVSSAWAHVCRDSDPS